MSRRTANKKHAKLYWPSRKRSSKTTNCTCTAKKWRARQKFFGACPTLQLSNSSRCHYPSDPATSAPWFLPEIAAMKTIYHLLTYLHMWSWQVCSSTHFPYPSLLPLPPFPHLSQSPNYTAGYLEILPKKNKGHKVGKVIKKHIN